jgi:hypothetical protein
MKSHRRRFLVPFSWLGLRERHAKFHISDVEAAVGIFMIKIIKLKCLGEERGLSRGEEGAAHTGASQPCTGQHKGTVAKAKYRYITLHISSVAERDVHPGSRIT